VHVSVSVRVYFESVSVYVGVPVFRSSLIRSVCACLQEPFERWMYASLRERVRVGECVRLCACLTVG
jgi:hypothetical protein